MTLETHQVTEKLIEHIKERFHEEDLELIMKAYNFARISYAQVKHPLGMPYIDYATEVAVTLVDLLLDPVLISAALIYPPPHVSNKVLDDIRKSFKDTNGLVRLIEETLHLNHFEMSPWSINTEQDTFKERNEILRKMFLLTIEESDSGSQEHQVGVFFQSKEKQTENLIRMFFDLITDVRALLIRLTDYLCFVKHLKDLLPVQKELLQYKLFAKLAQAIYAPIADRLGMWQLKSRLEDMSFRLLDPENYMAIAQQLADKKQQRVDYITQKIIPSVTNLLKDFDLKAKVYGRPKHIYGIYQKMMMKHIDFEHINDLLGIRIIVDTVKDCYTAEEIIHTFWLPVREFYEGESGRDWIEKPKSNHYQSLHTTIYFEDKMVEIQIRTDEMDEVAEYGIAAQHWLYKANKTYRKGRTPKVTRLRDQNWSRKLESLRKSLANEQQLSESEQVSPSRDRVFVITPKGHVIDLRVGARPLDFAYRIHTDLGHKYGGAKANSHLVLLDYKLKTGDIVELLPARPHKGPSRDWLSQKKDEVGNNYYLYVQTTQARSKIRNLLNKQKN